MIPLSSKNQKIEYYVMDIKIEDEKLLICYADGREECIPFSRHNLSVFRNRMVIQAKENIDSCLGKIAKESFGVYFKRFVGVIGLLVGFYFLYNLDIHVIMKIVLAVLGLGASFFYYLVSEISLRVLDSSLCEALATEGYIKNLSQFRYYDSQSGNDEYILPIEDIKKYNLSVECINQLVKNIEDCKAHGYEANEITLSYKYPVNRENNS